MFRQADRVHIVKGLKETPGFNPQSCLSLSRPSFLVAFSSKGAVLWSSDDLDGLGTGISIDGVSGDVYVAGFALSSEGIDTVVVHKVGATTIFEAVPCRHVFCLL